MLKVLPIAVTNFLLSSVYWALSGLVLDLSHRPHLHALTWLLHTSEPHQYEPWPSAENVCPADIFSSHTISVTAILSETRHFLKPPGIFEGCFNHTHKNVCRQIKCLRFGFCAAGKPQALSVCCVFHDYNEVCSLFSLNLMFPFVHHMQNV